MLGVIFHVQSTSDGKSAPVVNRNGGVKRMLLFSSLELFAEQDLPIRERKTFIQYQVGVQVKAGIYLIGNPLTNLNPPLSYWIEKWPLPCYKIAVQL